MKNFKSNSEKPIPIQMKGCITHVMIFGKFNKQAFINFYLQSAPHRAAAV